uniref:YcgJ family protein n=1 Tax=Yokenella regensburgei TaxID=158877 RepID=UPI0035A38E03
MLGLCFIIGSACSLAEAAEHNKLTNPAAGVVCDAYVRADATGISATLTTYLGAKKRSATGCAGRI